MARRRDGERGPVSRPAEESGLKPSLATTTAKASERVIADPLGKEDASQPRGRFDCLVSWGWGW